jgi:hypothetical protein
MPTTRSGANGSQATLKPTTRKRAGSAKPAPAAKRGKTENSKKAQKAVEGSVKGSEIIRDVKAQDAEENGSPKGLQKGAKGPKKVAKTGNDKKGEKSAPDEVMTDVKDEAREEEAHETEQTITNKSVIEDKNRQAAMPSSILEKGIIYFFFRSRVNVEEPHGVEDVARSYIILRPLPIGAKLGEGPLEDVGNARLLILPKKTLPKSHKDRFLALVEKAKVTVQELKEKFISGNDYVTKTAG